MHKNHDRTFVILYVLYICFLGPKQVAQPGCPTPADCSCAPLFRLHAAGLGPPGGSDLQPAVALCLRGAEQNGTGRKQVLERRA